MEKLKIVATVTIVTGSIGFILLLGGLFSATWIEGDLQSTSVKNYTEGKPITTNTSGSCSEGLFVKCCQMEIQSTYTSPTGFGSDNTSDYSCYIRHKSDFHGELFGGYQATQALAALTLICALLGLVLSWLFRFITKLQETPLAPLVKMILFFVAVLLVTITMIVVGAMFKKFTGLLHPKIGASIYVTAIADILILAAGIASTVAFILVRRSSDVSYGNF